MTSRKGTTRKGLKGATTIVVPELLDLEAEYKEKIAQRAKQLPTIVRRIKKEVRDTFPKVEVRMYRPIVRPETARIFSFFVKTRGKDDLGYDLGHRLEGIISAESNKFEIKNYREVERIPFYTKIFDLLVEMGYLPCTPLMYDQGRHWAGRHYYDVKTQNFVLRKEKKW